MHSRGPEFNSLNCSCNQFLCFFNYEGPKKFFLLVGRKFSGPALPVTKDTKLRLLRSYIFFFPRHLNRINIEKHLLPGKRVPVNIFEKIMPFHL